jgi:hypothetical protein
MDAKRTLELRLLPGEDVPRGDGKRSTTGASNSSRRAGRNPFSSGPPLELASKEEPEQAAEEAAALLSTLYFLIVQQWVQTLGGPYDWGSWPLGRYVFSETFLRNLEAQEDLEDITWICAMVACGLAHEFYELELEPRRGGPEGRTQVVRSSDGAEGYRCSILSGRGAGTRLDFWTLPSGVSEFDSFTAMRLVSETKAGAEPGPAEC